MSESERYRPMLAYLNRVRGVIAWRQNSGRILLPVPGGRRYRVELGPEGAPDLIGWLRGGRGLAVEVKTPGGRFRAAQGPMLDALERQGLLVLRGVQTVDELERRLNDADVPAR